MKILYECKLFLSYEGLGAEQYVNIVGIQIPRAILRALVAFMLFSLSTINLIRCFMAYPHGAQALLYPVLCFTLDVNKFVIYCALLWKTDQIAQLTDYLETAVMRRTFSFLTLFRC